MPKKKRRVLVTGVARWGGALVAQRRVGDAGGPEVIGIDIREPRYALGRADYLKLDIRHSRIGKLVRSVGIDTVVHTLTRIDSFDLDPRRAHEMNVIGTLTLLAGCAGKSSPVKRFVLKSSGHVYGSRVDQPIGLREDHRLDSNSKPQFVRDIVEVESYASGFAERTPGIDILTLRFSNSLNPDEPQPFARYLDLEVVPTVAGFDPTLQLIHRDDCVEALYLATKRGPAGAYNIGAPGAEPLSKLLDTAGKLHAPLLPPFGLELAAFALRRRGLASRPPQLLDLPRWGPPEGVGGEEPDEDGLVPPHPLREGVFEKPGGDGFGAALAAKPASELAGEHDPAGFGDVVDAHPGPGSQPADACNVDDGAA